MSNLLKTARRNLEAAKARPKPAPKPRGERPDVGDLGPYQAAKRLAEAKGKAV